MEINRLGNVVGVVANEDIVEGRMVLLTTHTFNYNFGSKTDLAAVKVPSTSTEAKAARFCITWAVDNRQPPYLTPMPAMDYALRGGFDQTANVPFNASVALTYPGYQNSKTIPSGTLALAMNGTVTVPSGCYIDSASIAKGAFLVAANTTDDGAGNGGKLKYASAYDADTCVGVVEAYDSTTGDLTFRVIGL